MAELQAIKRRLRSVSNTRQITKAMQLVSASKLRRAQMAAEAPRAFVDSLQQLVNQLATPTTMQGSPLFAARDTKRALAIIIAADRGLAGAYNSNLFRELGRLQRDTGASMSAITVGKRGALQLARTDNLDEIAAYEMDSAEAENGLARPILSEATKLFIEGEVDAVYLISTRFRSTSVQKVERTQLLPLAVVPNRAPSTLVTEPSDTAVLESAVKHLLEGQLYQAIVEARASEQAARMLAMMNATDNASDLIDDLTLARNNARQAAITQELAEISSGAEAVNTTN